MQNRVTQPIVRPVQPDPQQANSNDFEPTPVLLVPPAPVEPTPPAPQDHTVPAAEPPCEYPSAPDILAAVRAFRWPADTDTTTMAAPDCPIFLRQALEVLARDADRPMQHTVAAALGLGLPILHSFPGVTDCLEARQQLLRDSCDPYIRLWLDQAVPIDLLTGGLGHRRFTVRVAVARRRQIGLLAAGLGLQIGQCFTLALTAALIGSSYVPMDEANTAMYRTLVDLRERCTARAHHTERLLSAKPPDEATTVRRTIYDVLAGHPGW